MRSNAYAIILPLCVAFIAEGLSAPYVGFYAIPTIFMLSVFFASPIVFPSLNAAVAGLAGFVALSVWEWQVLYFLIPYFCVVSLMLYVFAKT